MQSRRWPQYKQAYINTFDKMLEERKRKGKVTQWKTPEEVYHWWLEMRPSEEDQLTIFE